MIKSGLQHDNELILKNVLIIHLLNKLDRNDLFLYLFIPVIMIMIILQPVFRKLE
jgi:hypothetical protein